MSEQCVCEWFCKQWREVAASGCRSDENLWWYYERLQKSGWYFQLKLSYPEKCWNSVGRRASCRWHRNRKRLGSTWWCDSVEVIPQARDTIWHVLSSFFECKNYKCILFVCMIYWFLLQITIVSQILRFNHSIVTWKPLEKWRQSIFHYINWIKTITEMLWVSLIMWVAYIKFNILSLVGLHSYTETCNSKLRIATYII